MEIMNTDVRVKVIGLRKEMGLELKLACVLKRSYLSKYQELGIFLKPFFGSFTVNINMNSMC